MTLRCLHHSHAIPRPEDVVIATTSNAKEATREGKTEKKIGAVQGQNMLVAIH
jgi:hypothetical protein